MPSLSERSSGFTDSVIRRMTRIANKYGAINLSQGFPDFDPPREITDRLKEIADTGPHQYPITWGAKNFRDALAKKQAHFMGREIDPVPWLGRSLEKEMATHSSIIAWNISWTEEPAELQSIGSQRVGHD